MSLRVDRVQLEIIINNDQARKQLRMLDEEMRQLQKDLKKIPEGTQEWIEKSERLSSIKTQIDNVKREIGITGMTLKELISHQKELNMVLLNMNPNIPQYKQLQQELLETTNRVKELRSGAKQAEGIFSSMFGAITMGELASRAIENLSGGVKNYFKEGIESAIKMADAQKLLLHALDGNKQKYQELIAMASEKAGTTLFSRMEVLEAEKFLALQGRSQEQIRKTITSAMDLSTVTGVILEQAVSDLDGTMEGKLGKSLGKLEKDFKSLSREQLYNGELINMVGEKYKGLAEAEMETTEGKVNQLSKAWQILRRSVGELFTNQGQGKFDGMIEWLTSFLKAVKDNISVVVSLSKVVLVMTAGWAAYKLVLGSVMAYERTAMNIKSAYTAVTGLFTRSKAVEAATVEAAAVANTAEAATATTATGAIVAQTVATEAATAATTALNTATKASPWGFIIGLVTAAAAAIWAFTNSSKSSQEVLNDLSADALKNTAQERVNLEQLIETAKDESRSKEDRQAAIEKLNNISPEYLGNITQENIDTRSSVVAIEEYIKSLERKAMAQAAQKKLVEIEEKLIDVRTNLKAPENKDISAWQQFRTVVKSIFSGTDYDVQLYEDNLKSLNEEEQQLIETKKSLKNIIEKETEVTEKQEKKSVNVTSKIKEMNLEQLEAEKDRLTSLGENIDKTDQMRLREITRMISVKERMIEKEKESNRKIIEQSEQLQQEIQNINEHNLAQRLTETQREIREVEQKYDVLIEKSRKFLRDNANLPESKKQELTVEIDELTIRKNETLKNVLVNREQEFAKDIADIHERLRVAKLSISEKEIYDINQKYDKAIREQTDAVNTAYDDLQETLIREYASGLVSQEEFDRRSIQLEEERSVALEKISKDAEVLNRSRKEETSKSLLTAERRFQEELRSLKEKRQEEYLTGEDKELAKIKAKYAKLKDEYANDATRRLEIEKAVTDEIEAYKEKKARETRQQVSQFLVQETQLLSDTLFTLERNSRDASTSAQLDELGKQKKAELDNKYLSEDQKKSIEEKYQRQEAAIKTKAWKAQQAAAEKQAIINGALAVVNILATMPWADFGVAHAIAIAAVVAKTIAEVAVIRSQKMPQFSEGGYTGKGKPEEPAGVVHKGEYVVPAEQLADPQVRKLVEIIEEKRTGKGFSKGGFTDEATYQIQRDLLKEQSVDHLVKIEFIPPVFKQPPSFNVPEIVKAIRLAPVQAQMELMERQTREMIHNLKLPEVVAKAVSDNRQPSDPGIRQSLDSLTLKLGSLDDLNKTLQTGIRAKMVYTEWEETLKGIDDMKNDTGI
ncbi:MAG: hypothetical protein NTU44_13455 [Bacteroidetes bacterium]|nr:hypothetical protein [Bacteroidota bacterium]